MSEIICPPYYRRHLWRGGDQCLRCGAVKSLRDERAFRENVLDYLLTWQARGHGVVVDIRHPKPSAPGREGGVSWTPGAPDLLVFRGPWAPIGDDEAPVYTTQALAIELKAGSGQQSAAQREWQARFELQGGIYRIVRNESEIDLIFSELGWPTIQEVRA